MENELNKITAVEWVIKELKNKDYLGTFCTADAWEEEEKKMRLIIEQAKAMDKEQRLQDMLLMQCIKDVGYDGDVTFMFKPIEYFEKTYGGNK